MAVPDPLTHFIDTSLTAPFLYSVLRGNMEIWLCSSRLTGGFTTSTPNPCCPLKKIVIHARCNSLEIAMVLL